jgi:uncharacterized membrane protein YcfT
MNQRIEWIDIAKGFGIFLVVAGHLMNGGESFVSRWIYSFHMYFIGYASEYIKPLFDSKLIYKGIEFVFVGAMCILSVWIKNAPWIVNRKNK